MIEELTALEQNGTWTLSSLSKGKHVVGGKWVSKVKCRANGSI